LLILEIAKGMDKRFWFRVSAAFIQALLRYRFLVRTRASWLLLLQLNS